MHATGESASTLVEWLAPAEVDMTGEPGSFVELAEGRRLMILARRSGVCRFLDAENRCTVHASRPLDCRLFPFDPRVSAQGRLRRLRVLPLDDCDYALDGSNDERAIVADDRARWAALAEYQALVARFNRRARTRKRLGKRMGNAAEFLSFLGLSPSP
jgi:Fe-S-cluster containining protein